MRHRSAAIAIFAAVMANLATPSLAQSTTLVARFKGDFAQLSLGTNASGGGAAIIVIQPDGEDAHSVMFTSVVEWAQFTALWSAARNVLPPHEIDVGKYQPPDDNSVVTVEVETDGGITVSTLDHSASSDAAFVEIEPQDFAAFDSALRKVSAFLAH